MELNEEARQFFKECGKKGGNMTLKRKGKEFFKEINRKGNIAQGYIVEENTTEFKLDDNEGEVVVE